MASLKLVEFVKTGNYVAFPLPQKIYMLSEVYLYVFGDPLGILLKKLKVFHRLALLNLSYPHFILTKVHKRWKGGCGEAFKSFLKLASIQHCLSHSPAHT